MIAASLCLSRTNVFYAGLFQVTVLEARNRVGGRMWSRTETVNGNVLRADMGAQWIQSAIGNPITRLARRMRLPIGRMNLVNQQYTVSGQAYSDSDASKAQSDYEDLANRAIQRARELSSDISLDEAFRAVDSALYLTPYVQVRAGIGQCPVTFHGALMYSWMWGAQGSGRCSRPCALCAGEGWDRTVVRHMWRCLYCCSHCVHGYPQCTHHTAQRAMMRHAIMRCLKGRLRR